MAKRKSKSKSRPQAAPGGRGGGVKLASLQASIKAKKMDWQCAETSMTALSEKEQRGHLGLSVKKEELQAMEKMIKAANQLKAFHAPVAAPPQVDWRSNGGNFVTPVKDQASCGSCVAFGTMATIESRANIACKTPGQSRDYSEAFLFYCGCGNCCGTGWNFQPALQYCQATGVAAESSFPYTPGNQPCKSGVTPLFKIQAYSSIGSMADRKAAIAGRGPVVAGMAVYQDFFSYTSGVYKHVSGNLAGYHAICCIGYDDAKQCWICKNSWGAGWGQSGFFQIAYGQCGIDTQFPFWEPTVPCPTPDDRDDCRRYVPYVIRVIHAARANWSLRACLLYYVCRRGRRPRCTANQIAIVRIVLQILARCPKYRSPFCRAIS